MKQDKFSPQLAGFGDKFSQVGSKLRELFGKVTGNLAEQGGEAGGSTRLYLGAGGAALVLIALVIFGYVYYTASGVTNAVQNASELRVLSQNLAKNALEAAAGN
ncbi:MAG TPA: hypothetical protein VGD18_00095, partial [Thiobacillaceae bacterium]